VIRAKVEGGWDPGGYPASLTTLTAIEDMAMLYGTAVDVCFGSEADIPQYQPCTAAADQPLPFADGKAAYQSESELTRCASRFAVA
jgi:hypothetical protein